VLQPGDEIVAIEGRRFAGLPAQKKIDRFGELVSAHKCAGEQKNGCVAQSPVELTIRRDGQVQTISVKPHYSAEAKRPLIGFSYGGEFGPITSSEALDKSTSVMGEVISRTGSVFAHIFEAEKRKEISSVVGISDVGHQAVDQGWRESFLLLALVSLSLGLINLVPIQPVSIKVMERATIIGFALVLMLMVIGVSNDIGRITGEGFNVSK
jgi:regulator of sigma E protease